MGTPWGGPCAGRENADRLVRDLAVMAPSTLQDLEREIERASRWCAVHGSDDPRSLWVGDSAYSLREDHGERRITRAFGPALGEREGAVDRSSRTSGRDSGRLIVHGLSQSVADGASKLMSRGLFDVLDTPPPMTWGALLHDEPDAHADLTLELGYLLAWVPRRHLDAALAGQDENPVDSIVWLDESNVRARAIIPWLRLP